MSSHSRPVTVLPKTQVLAGLFDSWDGIEDLTGPLSEQQWRLPSLLPGWTVHNVVAHMVGTESMLSGIATPDIDVSGSPHVLNEIGAMNEAWVRSLEGLSGVELLTRFAAVTSDRRAALSKLGDDEWNAVGFTPAGPDTYGRFMRIRTFDCWLHEIDIRDALDFPATDAELACVAARSALDEMTASMGFVIGKRGKAPEGSRVSMELTGALARTIRVAVDERAAVVDDFGGAAPTAVIRLDGLDFVRLCGGRIDSAPVEYDGDEAVGRRIVEKLNYVI